MSRKEKDGRDEEPVTQAAGIRGPRKIIQERKVYRLYFLDKEGRPTEKPTDVFLDIISMRLFMDSFCQNAYPNNENPEKARKIGYNENGSKVTVYVDGRYDQDLGIPFGEEVIVVPRQIIEL